MKKIFILIVLFTGISLVSFAQTKEKHYKDKQSHFTSELGFTEDQQKKVDQLNSEYTIKIDDLKKNESLSKKEKNTKRKELFAQKRSLIKEILTTEQQAKLEARQAKRFKEKNTIQNNRRKKYDFANLNFTTDQKQKFEELNKDFRVKSKDLAQDRHAAINSILTPEQQIKLKDERSKPDRKKAHGFRGKKQDRYKNLANKGSHKLTPEIISQLDTLEDSYFQKKQVIKRSRVAPEEQERRIAELRKQYRNDKREIIKSTQSTKNKI